jgi:hypothetical protein
MLSPTYDQGIYIPSPYPLPEGEGIQDLERKSLLRGDDCRDAGGRTKSGTRVEKTRMRE